MLTITTQQATSSLRGFGRRELLPPSSPNRPGDSTSEERIEPSRSSRTPRTTTTLAILLATYLAAAFVGLHQLGVWSQIEQLLFHFPDALQYRTLAAALTTGEPLEHPRLLAYRPYLFPLVLSLHQWLGATGYAVMQLLFNAATLALVYLTTLRLTSSMVIGTTAAVALAVHPTFTLLAIHGLSESFGILLVALIAWGIAATFHDASPHSRYRVLLVLSMAVCVRPLLTPFLVIWLVHTAAHLWRTRARLERSVGWIVVALLPVFLQLTLSTVATGRPTVSEVGRDVLHTRFFPAVYGFATSDQFVSYRSETARRAHLEHPTLGDALVFMARHPAATARAYGHLLRMNLLAETTMLPGFEHPLARTLRTFSGALNHAWCVLHIVGLIALVVVSRFTSVSHGRCTALLSLATLVAFILLPSALTYWQGDRVFTLATPSWCVHYATLGWILIRSVRQRLARRRTPR